MGSSETPGTSATSQVGDSVPPQGWAQNPWLAYFEFAAIAFIFWADVHHHILLSKTPYLLALGWISLRLRGLRWRDVGLARFRGWGTTLLVGGICGVTMEVFELFVSQPLFMKWTGKAPDLDLFRALHGDIKWTLLAIVGAWTLAAFGEEMVFRGYLLNRIAGVFPLKSHESTRAAWIIALVLSSAVFGAAHLGQGITGQLENALDGLLLGAIYLACGRNLGAVIVAHGITDTLDLLLMFAGLYPTLK